MPTVVNVVNGRSQTGNVKTPPAMHTTPRRVLLGRGALLRHPQFGRGAQIVAALVVGTYAVDDRYVIVQAFPIGKQSVQLADVHLLDDDPGETNDAVAWLVT